MSHKQETNNNRYMLKHKCGIFGLYSKNNHNNKNIIVNTIKGLENLQHRGRESAGISYINEDGEITIYKNFGLVKDIFLQEHYQKVLPIML